MTKGFSQYGNAPIENAETGTERTIAVLAVGDLEEWRRRGNTLPVYEKVAFASFHQITQPMLETLGPDLVLSPLLARGFDCIDLAQVLHDCGFRGQYRAMATTLPKPYIVRREIRTLCPGLDFDILGMPQMAVLNTLPV